ncbi:MAG: hypothetical protein K5984_00930 [Bacteroidales bacterium]|nr:hypothetical protein [Bacteroidales bacterium]
MIDKNVQMMDAGMAMFDSEAGFGEVIGMTKSEMMRLGGKIYEVSDSDGGKFSTTIPPKDLPDSTAECDLFLDWSSSFRKRYISARIEAAGENRYVIRFKEGNKSATLRNLMYSILGAYGIFGLILGADALGRLSGVALALFSVYMWMKPSARARKAAEELIRAFNTNK